MDTCVNFQCFQIVVFRFVDSLAMFYNFQYTYVILCHVSLNRRTLSQQCDQVLQDMARLAVDEDAADENETKDPDLREVALRRLTEAERAEVVAEMPAEDAKAPDPMPAGVTPRTLAAAL